MYGGRPRPPEMCLDGIIATCLNSQFFTYLGIIDKTNYHYEQIVATPVWKRDYSQKREFDTSSDNPSQYNGRNKTLLRREAYGGPRTSKLTDSI
jgi:hypothetical protein